MHDWNDIRYFLAAGRTSSLNAAARLLRTSQPTVSRRIAALEKDAGKALFVRHSNGLTLTTAGEALWQRALLLEEAALAVEQEVAAQDEALSGPVRISATDGFGTLWLTPRLATVSAAKPEITLEVVLNNEVADLMRREADIALRLARPVTANLVARRVGDLSFNLFAARDYVSRYGCPETLEDLPRHRFVTLDVRQPVMDETWHGILDAGAPIAYRSNSSLSQIAALRAGIGIALVPAYVGKLFPDLVPVLTPNLWRTREVWLVAHPEVRRSARVAFVFDALVHLFHTDGQSLRPALRPDTLA